MNIQEYCRISVAIALILLVTACQGAGRANHVSQYLGVRPTTPIRVPDEAIYYDADKRRAILTEDISKFFDSSESAIRDFFIEEATAAGVTRFGPMPPPSQRLKGQQKFCGSANRHTFIVLLNIDNPLCMNLRTFAHEIAHIAVFDVGCFGHGSVFYLYMTGIAERFEAKFPGVRWLGRQPTESVYDQSLVYHKNESKC